MIYGSKRINYFVHVSVQKFKIVLSTSISDFRRDIKAYFDKFTEDFETLINFK